MGVAGPRIRTGRSEETESEGTGVGKDEATTKTTNGIGERVKRENALETGTASDAGGGTLVHALHGGMKSPAAARGDTGMTGTRAGIDLGQDRTKIPRTMAGITDTAAHDVMTTGVGPLTTRTTMRINGENGVVLHPSSLQKMTTTPAKGADHTGRESANDGVTPRPHPLTFRMRLLVVVLVVLQRTPRNTLRTTKESVNTLRALVDPRHLPWIKMASNLPHGIKLQ